MSRLRLLTGIDLPLEPSCGSTIWASDVYHRLTPDFRTTFLALPGSGTWAHHFEVTASLKAVKQPYGPEFNEYADALAEEVQQLVTEQQPDLIHAQHLGFGLALAFTRAAGTVPVISIAHGTDVIAAAESEQAREVLAEIVAGSTAVVVPNAMMAEQVNTLTDGACNDRLVTVPWGIPLPSHPPARLNTSRRLHLVHAGRLDANKSTVTAIDALARAEEAHHLTVFGTGDELPALVARTTDLGLQDRVHFEPFLPRDVLWRRFGEFDALLFTTRHLEAFGLVPVEAQAHGLPVLYGDLPGLGDTLGAGALPYPPGDASALATCINRLADDPALRRMLSDEAERNARLHDIAATAAHLRQLSLDVREAAVSD